MAVPRETILGKPKAVPRETMVGGLETKNPDTRQIGSVSGFCCIPLDLTESDGMQGAPRFINVSGL